MTIYRMNGFICLLALFCFLSVLFITEKTVVTNMCSIFNGANDDLNGIQICSFNILREQAILANKSPHPGEHHKSNVYDNTIIGDWQPTFCRLSFSQSDSTISKDELTECILERHIRNVILLGDSNGARYHKGLITHLQHTTDAVCVEHKKEKPEIKYPNLAYFSNDSSIPAEETVLQERECTTCKSVLSVCTFPNIPLVINVEYIAMEFTIDKEISTYRTFQMCRKLKRKICDYSTTSQEFILTLSPLKPVFMCWMP